MVEWTGGGNDTALQPSRLHLPSSLSYPDSAKHTSEQPYPLSSFLLSDAGRYGTLKWERTLEDTS